MTISGLVGLKMRIYSAVRHSSNPAFYYGALWRENFYPALRGLGHEVTESQLDLLPASRFMHLASPDENEDARRVRASISESLLHEVRQAHARKPIDLFLSYFYNSHCDPDAVREIKSLGITTVNFYCNSMYQFDLVAEISPAFDFSWHTEKNARRFYESAGANPIWVQMGADPELYHPVGGSTPKPGACFVGQRYCDRDRWLAALVKNEIPVDIYGSGWLAEQNGSSGSREMNGSGDPAAGSLTSYSRVVRENIARQGWLGGGMRSMRQAMYAIESRRLRSKLQPYAKGKAGSLAEVFSSYEVVLNFCNVWADGRPGSKLIPHVRLRDFEAPMCRSAYLTGYSEEIEEFYEVGREIDTYNSPEELVDKVKFYLANPSTAEKLREAGYQRARRDHTWVERFRELFGKIGGGSV